jgi:hypothetical protein
MAIHFQPLLIEADDDVVDNADEIVDGVREDVRIGPAFGSLVDQTELLIDVFQCRPHFGC